MITKKLNEIIDGLGDYIKEKNPTFDNNFPDVKGGILYNSLKHLDFDIYVEILSGKYKGSIGLVKSYGKIILNDTHPVVSIKIPIKKSLKLLPNYTGPKKLEVKERQLNDIFGVNINQNDKVIFAERGILHFGIISGFDFINNNIFVQTLKGKKVLNPRKSQFANISQINETFIENGVLLNKLKN